ncbi:MAG: lipid IV(A) 3-deoxy-D-manno-octulosonic acid transferase [Halieaceae bacterium]|nr:lipid IV(A) 3-deoxy-D-manno-octulosonic acid transferase [Halieaceae bacterium]
MRQLYNAVMLTLLPLVLIRVLWRSRLAPDYRHRLAERLGFAGPYVSRNPTVDEPAATLWIHAASLGETIAAAPLIDSLLESHPDTPLLVTTTTPTGSEQLRKLFGDRVQHQYAPWDTPIAVRRFLRRTRPKVLVLMETELWPNLLHYSRAAGCAVILANARLSARSAAGYARFPGLTRPMLESLEYVAAQSEADAQRLVELGLPATRVRVSGSIKFDIVLEEAHRSGASELRAAWRGTSRSVCLFASTHPGEERIALSLLESLRADQDPQALLVIAPRHPERFEEVARLLREEGWAFQRRSETRGALKTDTAVLLVDTLGELLTLFGAADLAVIGGSFVTNGGHNPLEAAIWGIPVLAGPSMYNFADVAERLRSGDALEQVDDGEALAKAVNYLLANPGIAAERGRAARDVVEASRGARAAILALIEAALAPRQPSGA